MDTASQNFLEDSSRRTAVALSCAVWYVLGVSLLVVRVAGLARRSLAPFSLGCRLGHFARVCRRSLIDSASVAKELQKRRLTHAHGWIQYGVFAAFVVVGVTSIRIMQPSLRFHSCVQDVSVLVACFILLFLAAFPTVVTLTTLDVWSSMLAACIVMWASPLALERQHAAPSALLPFAAAMLLSMFNLNLRLNLLWVCALTASSCSSILFGYDRPLRGREGCAGGLSPFQNGTHVAMSGMIIAGCVTCIHRFIRLAAQYEMEACISRNELQAAHSVLRTVCDVVVELDSDFCLQVESPRLVDMLLLNSQRSLLGEDVRSFLASPQDRQKFTEQLSQACLDSAEQCAAFHVSMKDSSSIALVVEVYSMRFVTRGAQAAYFVGIREFTDSAPMFTKGSAAEAINGDGQHGYAPVVGFPPPARLADGSSEDSSDVNPDAPAGDVEFLIKAEAVGWIDVLTPDYTVRHTTPAFAQHLQADSEFLAALKPVQRLDFIEWAQLAYLDLLQEGSGSVHRRYGKRLHIRCSAPAAARGLRPQRTPPISALPRLDLTPPPGEQPHSQGVVRLVLQDIRARRRAPERPSTRGTPPVTPRTSLGSLQRPPGPEGRGPAGAAAEAAAEGPPPPAPVRLSL
ncbi:unnamed protein product [Prorocentrum cordatum]|uniref:PAS domain-containing protein n=1 Tax=Prorocentrum cordatum TaxID=2364126 RepID=A0ABN9T3B4_9DINO|nr:unnamed protein product [Polarella glacialis]